MKIIFSSVFFLFALAAYPQSRQLIVTVKGIEKPQGFLMIELLDEFENRLDAKKVEVPEDTEFLKIIFSTNTNGPFAVKVFHDENANGVLDKNFMGIPKEKYGFSNNPRIIAGPPKHAEILFDWSNKPHVILLK